VNFQAAPGDFGGSFSGDAHSVVAVPALVVGWGQYQSNALAASVAWDARFKVNQPGLRYEINLGFNDYGAAATDGYAYASGQSSVDLRLNGVSQLTDSQRASCNTVLLECESVSPNQGSISIILDYLVVGQVIDISGFLSTDTHATAGPICGSPTSITSCFGLGLASSGATFSIRAISEPPYLPLLGTTLLLAVLVPRIAMFPRRN
jgi:hypothetical protein